MEIVDSFPQRRGDRFAELADGKIRRFKQGVDYDKLKIFRVMLWKAAQQLGMKTKTRVDGEWLYVQFIPK